MRIFDFGKYGKIIFALGLFLVFVAAVLAYNFQVSNRFSQSVRTVKFLAEQQRQPALIASLTESIVARLKTGAEVEPQLNELRSSVRSLDRVLEGLANGAVVQDPSGNAIRLNAGMDSELESANHKIWQRWSTYKDKLDPALRISGELYETNASLTLSARGQRLQRSLEEVLPLQAGLDKELSGAVELATNRAEAANTSLANQLRIVQGAAIFVALGLFGVFMFYFLGNLRKDELTSSRARKETTDILNTVNEGLFLLDRNLKIGTERSLALGSIFRRDDLDGLSFEEVLRKIVPDKTLKTAMDYVALLWGERVNEKLVKTINPLNEVEVHFDNPAGGFETHFLEFDFNRVKSEGSLSHLLVTVNDVTKRVMLARELQESQEKAQAQLDLLLRILHVEPEALTSYLSDAEVSLKMVNTILREPAREEAVFRTKIDNIYRQIHAVKGEASALGLKTVEQRAHAFEESLNDLKQRANISGNDFLPLVVKLDDLFNHLAQVREMLGRLVDLHQAIANRRASGGKSSEAASVASNQEVDEWLSVQNSTTPGENTSALEALVSGSGLARTLDKLAQQVADNNAKQVQLSCVGLESVPEVYRRTVKDVAIQLVRNAVVHGIETPAERSHANKTEVGLLTIEFADHGEQGMQLTVQDDGRGLQLELIKSTAITRGLITPAQAAMLDPRQTMALIFKPGFSTAQNVTTDAGRGAGMDLVRSLVAEAHGRVGLATARGRYSKFKIWLPAAEQAVAAA